MPFPSGLWELTIDGEIKISPDMQRRFQSDNRIIRFQITYLNLEQMLLLRTISTLLPADTVESNNPKRLQELTSEHSEVIVLTRDGL